MFPRKSMVAMLSAVLAAAPLVVPIASAQGRVNDRDMEVLIRNLRDDSKSFQSAFKESIQKSVIRKTSEEKSDRQTVEHFVKQTEGMLNQFRKTKHNGSSLPVVLDTGAKIDRMVSQLQLGEKTNTRWAKVRTELDQLARATGVANPLDQGSSHLAPNAPAPKPLGSPGIGSWISGSAPHQG